MHGITGHVGSDAFGSYLSPAQREGLALLPFLGPSSSTDGSWPGRSYYGDPHYVCPHCGANYWYQERRKHLSTKTKPVYMQCCRGGIISFSVYLDCPSPLAEFLRFDGGTECSRFLCLIREYNSMFAFTSLGVQVDNSVNVGRVLMFSRYVEWSAMKRVHSLLLRTIMSLSLPSFMFTIHRMSLRIGWVYFLLMVLMLMKFLLLLINFPLRHMLFVSKGMYKLMCH